MWDERYSEPEWAYGCQPNDFLKAYSKHIPPQAKVLCLAEGQGRNAIFCAQLGHNVTAVDQSTVGLERAQQLAKQCGVAIKTIVADLADFDLGDQQWDAIISIAAHLPPQLRAKVHRQVVQALKPKGVFILEAYCPAHLELPGVGGPPPEHKALLMPLDMLQQELSGLQFKLAHEIEREISEGQYHQGLSGVVQILASKPT